MTTLPPGLIRSCAVLALGALAAACGPRPDGSTTRVSRDTLCADVNNAYECAQKVEDLRLVETDIGVERSGDTLVIPVPGGEHVRLVNEDAGGPENVFYSYRDHLKDAGYHVVDVHYWEGSAHILVDDSTGRETRVMGPPVASPDGRRLVVASAAGVAGYSPNELQVWRVTPAGLELEWEVQPDDWGAADPRWIDARTVRFQRTRHDCANNEPVCYDEAMLRLRDGEWEVRTP
mgnify:CR=1 FL=1